MSDPNQPIDPRWGKRIENGVLLMVSIVMACVAIACLMGVIWLGMVVFS